MFCNMSFKFENVIVDFLLCPTAQDNFRSMKLQELLYNIRYDVHIDQIEDVMQILLNAHIELEKFKLWKIRGIDRNKCVLMNDDINSLNVYVNEFSFYIFR